MRTHKHLGPHERGTRAAWAQGPPRGAPSPPSDPRLPLPRARLSALHKQNLVRVRDALSVYQRPVQTPRLPLGPAPAPPRQAPPQSQHLPYQVPLCKPRPGLHPAPLTRKLQPRPPQAPPSPTPSPHFAKWLPEQSPKYTTPTLLLCLVPTLRLLKRIPQQGWRVVSGVETQGLKLPPARAPFVPTASSHIPTRDPLASGPWILGAPETSLPLPSLVRGGGGAGC